MTTKEEEEYLRSLEGEYSPERRRNVRGRIIRNRAARTGGGSPITLISSLNPSVSGNSVTFTSTVVLPGNPTGTISFFDGVTQIGTNQTISGTPPSAAVSTSALTIGSHAITARYNGDATHGVYTSTILAQGVSPLPTSTALGSSANPSTAGSSVTFTATLTGGGTGTVSFYDGGSLLGTNALSGATATLATSALSIGSHSITATYNGDATHAASTSPVLTQTVNGIATTTSLGSSLNPSNFADNVIFTATVAPTSTGTVNFFDNAVLIGSGTLSGATATFSTNALSVAVHPITATYVGDATHNGSTSSVLNQTVNAVAGAGLKAPLGIGLFLN